MMGTGEQRCAWCHGTVAGAVGVHTPECPVTLYGNRGRKASARLAEQLTDAESRIATLTRAIDLISTVQVRDQKLLRWLETGNQGETCLYLRQALSMAYQYAGAFGMPVKVLDNFAAALRGVQPPHEWPAVTGPGSLTEQASMGTPCTVCGIANGKHGIMCPNSRWRIEGESK